MSEEKSTKLKEFGRGLLVFAGTSAGTGFVIGVMVVLIRAGVEGQVDLPFLQRSLDFLVNNWQSVVVPSVVGGMVIGGMTTVALFAPPEGQSGSFIIDSKGENEPDDEEFDLEDHRHLKEEEKEVIKTHAGPGPLKKEKEPSEEPEEKEVKAASRSFKSGGGSEE